MEKRFRKKNFEPFRDGFIEYLYSKHPEMKYKYDKGQIRKIVETFNALMAKTAIEYREGVEFPLFGKRIVLYKYLGTKSKFIDFHKYRKDGQRIKYNNLKTDNYCLKIFLKKQIGYIEIRTYNFMVLMLVVVLNVQRLKFSEKIIKDIILLLIGL